MKSRQEFPTDLSYKEYLRTYFAAMAMQGMLAAWPEQSGNVTPNAVADYAVTCADAILKHLE